MAVEEERTKQVLGGGVGEDGVGEGMRCSDHPYTSSPGGICAFCLQDKLGKLLSSSASSKPLAAVAPSSSSFSPPSLGSHRAAAGASSSLGNSDGRSESHPYSGPPHGQHSSRRARLGRIPFHLPQKKKKKTESAQPAGLCRSKSTATPRPGRFPAAAGFWSFLHLSKASAADKSTKGKKNSNAGYESESPDAFSASSSFGRKVSRSKSVGCGSRSFSGDFFGFGDCTLRRVESHREAKPATRAAAPPPPGAGCGGIFRGFVLTPANPATGRDVADVNSPAASHGGVRRSSRSWGWAFASPTRAFGSGSSSSSRAGKRESRSTATPNLAAIPSLLVARN